MPERKKKDSESEKEPGSLYALALATAKGQTLERLHDQTGLSISWLRKFRAGEILNPSVNRVELILIGFGKLKGLRLTGC